MSIRGRVFGRPPFGDGSHATAEEKSVEELIGPVVVFGEANEVLSIQVCLMGGRTANSHRVLRTMCCSPIAR